MDERRYEFMQNRDYVLSYKEVDGHIIKLVKTFFPDTKDYKYVLEIDNTPMTTLRTFKSLERKDFVDTLMGINEYTINLFLGKFKLSGR